MKVFSSKFVFGMLGVTVALLSGQVLSETGAIQSMKQLRQMSRWRGRPPERA